jgi:hypothetical protein
MSPLVLHVLTTRPLPDNVLDITQFISCSGSYLCPCAHCDRDRRQAVIRGVRPEQELPVKIRHAA